MTTQNRVNNKFYQIVTVDGAGDVVNLTIPGSIFVAGNITSNNANMILAANTVAANYLVSLDSNLGNVDNVFIGGGLDGQFIKTDGNGNLTFANVAATPGGNTTEVQFNDAGSLTGDVNFTFDKTTGALSAVEFIGSGAGLTNISAGSISGSVGNSAYAENANVANTATTADTVTTAAQPNITSVGTLTDLTVSGNVNLTDIANLIVPGGSNGQVIFTDGAGNLSFNTLPNTLPAGSNGDIQFKNGNLFSADANLNWDGANLKANFFQGDGGLLSNIVGANVTGEVNFANMANYAGNVVTAAQPNITSVGNLVSLDVTGNITGNDHVIVDTVKSLTGELTLQSTAGNITLNANGGIIDATSHRIVNLLPPTADTDAATKLYVDTLAEGLHVHASADAATTDTLANISAGTITYDNGTAGVGATLTTTGAFTVIDGVTLTSTSRILVKDEATAAHNGIYDYTSSTVLTRSADFDSSAEVAGGDFLFVTGGTTYASTGWVQTTDLVTVGTDPVIFQQFSGAGTYTAGTGLSLDGTVFSISNTAVVTGSYGNGDRVASFTVNQQGQLTEASNIVITANAANLSGTALNNNIITSNLTTVGTLGNVSIAGNVNANAIVGSLNNFVTINANGYVTTFANTGLVDFPANIDVADTVITPNLQVSATANLGDVGNVKIAGGTAGQVLSTDGAGNLSYISVSASTISNGTSNVTVTPVDGNVDININSVLTMRVSGSLVDVTGNLVVSGNANADNLNITANANANIVNANLVSTDNANVTSNITAGNITAGDITSTANVSAANIDATGNVTVANITATGLVTLGNVDNVKITGGNLGDILSTDGNGNISWILSGGGGGGGSAISNGTSSVNIPVINSNVITTVNGIVIATATETEFNITGNVTATNAIFTGNVSGTNANFSANVSGTNAEFNGNLAVTGNATITADLTANNATITNDLTANTANFTNVAIYGTLSNPTAASLLIADNLRISSGNLDFSGLYRNITGVSSITGNTGTFNNIFTGNLSTGNITSTGSGINFNGKWLGNIGEPLTNNSAATKNYVDLFVQGISVKTAVRVSTNADLVPLSGGTVTYDNGTDGVGATLTTTGSFTAIDGVTLNDGDRVLVKNEATEAYNGIYVRTSATVLTRATDSDTPTKLKAGVFVFIEAGTLYQDTGWVQVNTITTIGTDPVTFNQFAGAGTYTAGPGLELVGTQFSLADDISVTGNVTVGNLLTVTGNTELTGTANVWGNLLANANLSVTESVTVGANLSVTGETNLGAVANVTITGGSNAQFIQTDGTGNLQFANALQHFTVVGNTNISGNGISIANANVNATGNSVTITNTGVISYDKITYPDLDIGDDVFMWDAQQGAINFKNINNAAFDSTDLGYILVPSVNSSQGTVWSRRSFNWQNPNADVMLELDVQVNGTADSYTVWWASNNANGNTVNRSGVVSGASVGGSVGVDFFNYAIYVNGVVSNNTATQNIRTGATFGKLQILHRYIDSQNTMIYVFWQGVLVTYRNVGAFTSFGTYFGISAQTGGLNATVRMRRFIIRNGNDFKYQHLSALPVILTFNYTGADQTWVAPSWVNKAYVTVQGASGSNSAAGSGTGGRAANIHGHVPIIPGQNYTIAVGGTPVTNSQIPAVYGGGGWGGDAANTSNRGTAGGGYSALFQGSISQANAIIVAAGGGGARGGGATGSSGGNATVGLRAVEYDGFAGTPRSGTFPNVVGGGGQIVGFNGAATGGTAGVPVDTNNTLPEAGIQFKGGNGGGTANTSHVGGGGGGGGYAGGGGAAAGATATGGGGGGASYFVDTGSSFYPLNIQGGAYGNGIITITYNGRP